MISLIVHPFFKTRRAKYCILQPIFNAYVYKLRYFMPSTDNFHFQKSIRIFKNKFPGKRMVWLGMSARGLTPLVYFKGSVNGSVYCEKVLDKVIVGDILQRKKTKGLPIHKRKMFPKNSDTGMIFEQDFAQPHSTNENQEFMEEHFPAHTPTLCRHEDNDPLFLDQM